MDERDAINSDLSTYIFDQRSSYELSLDCGSLGICYCHCVNLRELRGKIEVVDSILLDRSIAPQLNRSPLDSVVDVAVFLE